MTIEEIYEFVQNKLQYSEEIDGKMVDKSAEKMAELIDFFNSKMAAIETRLEGLEAA